MVGRLGDGLITVGVHTKLVDRFIAAGGAGKPRYTELNVRWPLKKQRRDAWHMRGGPLPVCRARSSQTSDSRPILRKLPAPSLRRRSRRRSSVVQIPHVTLRPSRRPPRRVIHTSGCTRSGRTRQVFFQFYAHEVLLSSSSGSYTARRKRMSIRADWHKRIILGAAGGFIGTLAIQALLTASQKWLPNTVPAAPPGPVSSWSRWGKRHCPTRCVSASHRWLKRVQPGCWLSVTA